MRRLMPLALLVPLAACGLTPQGSLVREAVETRGAALYDEGLVNSEFFICRAASVGAVLRRYGRSRDLSEAWRRLCQASDEATIFGPFEETPQPVGSAG